MERAKCKLDRSHQAQDSDLSYAWLKMGFKHSFLAMYTLYVVFLNFDQNEYKATKKLKSTIPPTCHRNMPVPT